MECHGSGGWQTWSLFGMKVEIPEEFLLQKSKLMTGRLEIDWMRKRRPGLLATWRRDETLSLTRVSLADVLLENKTLDAWTLDNIAHKNKQWLFMKFKEGRVRDHEAVCSEGVFRDIALRIRRALTDFAMRRRAPRAQLRVWHCEPSNKIYAFVYELTPTNDHVAADVLDSLECHS
jgi:hypothetical protein